MILQLLSPEDAKAATDYMLDKEREGKLQNEKVHFFGPENQLSYRSYQDPFFCDLALKVQPKIEESFGAKLYPTYTYTRLYKEGFILGPHKDRPACELSSSITIGYGGRSSPWELYIEDDEENEIECLLEPGYGLIYEGVKYRHWRYRLDHGWQVQSFVHYVMIDGPVYHEILKRKPDFDFSIPFNDFQIIGDELSMSN